MSRTRRGLAALVGAVAVAALVAPTALAAPARPAAPSATPTPTGTITVSAAASLTDVLPVIAAAFQKRYPRVTVRFNFGGSPALVQQLIAGAPVDVLATASESTMWQAVAAGRASQPLLFAKNTMAIAMPPDNPARITGPYDLARPGVLLGLCAPTVPCGSAARQVMGRLGITLTPVTLELDVRALLAKVISGDLDAGIVYVTDVRWAGSRVSSLAIPPGLNATTTYPIAPVIGSANPVAARAFVDYVRFSPSAQGILRSYGFARPW